MHITRAGTPPLIAAPTHHWQTLLTILMQAQNISALVMGPAERKTIVSLDLGLYQPAKKLQMARTDLNHLILRTGELRRGEATHVVTLQALFLLYQEAFSENSQEDLQSLEDSSKKVAEACSKGIKEEVKRANAKLIEVIESKGIMEKMAAFDDDQEKHPMFKVTRQYMRMVMEMLVFIKAVRTGDWELHLRALDVFTKYFFAHDRLNYARMIPLYLAEMQSLKASDPAIYDEFIQGNWVVNKNAKVPFCALGADHGLEHINRSMKVTGGLVGITLNPSARTKYFFTASELARLAEQAKDMAGVTSKTKAQHHNLANAVLTREDKNVEKLRATIEQFTNPFLEKRTDLFNLVTKVVMPEKVKEDLCNQSKIGQTLYQTFIKERIQKETVNLWSPMKKRKLQTWKSSNKVMKVSTKEKVVELREDRSLFARMMMVCKSRPEIDIKDCIGQYEFSLVPRSLFAADGSMIHCSCESALMAILEKVPGETQYQMSEQNKAGNHNTAQAQIKVDIIDGMVELQSLDKPDHIKNVAI